MDFSAIFLVFAASMWAVWRRHEGFALAFVFLGMALTVALYLHHATESLPLSF